MGASINKAVRLTLFGESHGPLIGATLDGLAPGLKLDLDFIRSCLKKRSPQKGISTTREEVDEIQFVSGYYNHHTTGGPLTMLIENKNTQSKDYDALKQVYRPGHADYSGEAKYLGFEDERGSGAFSGRMTVAIVAAGAIALSILKEKHIEIATHIYKVMDLRDSCFANKEAVLLRQIQSLAKKDFPALDDTFKDKVKDLILKTKENGDSLGAVMQSAVLGLSPGLGEPFFDSVESVLAHLLFSIPGLKGLEFGSGFDFANHSGFEVRDEWVMEGRVKTKSNHNGGLNGGITNGMPVVFQSVIKPTSSIAKAQATIKRDTKEATLLAIEGRHDPAIFPRAAIIIDALTALGILDLLTLRFGYLNQRSEG
ncbi:MAG: chorismate synthase [Erysipelotrichaceae bacterium]|jgi:chorismate synthase|nr:chorismate synthase [Erysipelotrichaceae bacterium]